MSEPSIPVLEEKAVVRKEAVATGRVRVATKTRQVEETAAASLAGEEVEVTRVPVDKPVAGDLPQVRTEGDTTIVPVFEEVLVVEKRLLLVEEVHVTRRTVETHQPEEITLRREEVTVERVAPGAPADTGGTESARDGATLDG